MNSTGRRTDYLAYRGSWQTPTMGSLELVPDNKDRDSRICLAYKAFSRSKCVFNSRTMTIYERLGKQFGMTSDEIRAVVEAKRSQEFGVR